MKDAIYFSHDSNARNDIKIKAMRKEYGAIGYAAFWIIIEMLRESNDYKLPLKPFTFVAIEEEIGCENFIAEQFINSCTDKFELFKIKDGFFFSESLFRRMEKRDEINQKKKIAAKARWDKALGETKKENDTQNLDADAMHNYTDAMQMQCTIMQSKVKESKVKESKVNKDILVPNKFEDDSSEISISKYLLLNIKKNNPSIKEPNIQTWASHIDKMIRLDNRSLEDIKLVIDFATKDTFWQANILSTEKLRKQFDQLYIKAGKTKSVPEGMHQSRGALLDWYKDRKDKDLNG